MSWCDVCSGWSGAGITRRASNPADLHRGVGLRRPEGTPGRRRNRRVQETRTAGTGRQLTMYPVYASTVVHS